MVGCVGYAVDVRRPVRFADAPVQPLFLQHRAPTKVSFTGTANRTGRQCGAPNIAIVLPRAGSPLFAGLGADVNGRHGIECHA